MKKFLSIFFNPFIGPVFIISIIIFIFTIFLIPRFSYENKIEQMTNNAIQTIDNLKKTRAYYSENVVKVIKNSPNSNTKINFDYETNKDTIPLPATLVHDIAELTTEKDKEIKLVSEYPFPNRKDRILDNFEKESLSYLVNNPNEIYTKKVIENNIEKFKIAIPDVFRENSCVACHNTRADSPKKDWNLGDVRGVFEITFPIEKGIVLTNMQISGIFILLLFILICLMIHYTIMSIRNKKLSEITKQELEEEIQKRTTELKNSIKLLNQYKFAVDSSAIVSKSDKNGRITFVNDEFLKVSKYTQEELIGHNHNIIRHESMPKDIFKELWATINSKKIWKGEIVNKAKDGTLYYVATTIVPILDTNDEVEEYLAIRFDITKIIEAQIKAKKADEAKSSFLANMSHEIRTPLNAIMGFSSLLSTSKELNKKSQKQAQVINSSAETLLTIINDILDVSKIESGNFVLNNEEVCLKLISENVIELFSTRAIEKKIRLILNIDNDLPNCIISDGFRIRQILSNLLSNAIKFTNNNGKVYLNIQNLGYENNKIKIHFEILDTGIGIPKDKITTIFKPFVQVDNTSNKKYQGTGLGLSICSHIIRSLGSRIEIESEENKGTKFYFDLTFNTCSKDFYKNKNFLTDVNFKVHDTSEIFDYYKNYLTIFGTINDNSRKTDVLIINYSSEEFSDLNLIRKEFGNIPKLFFFDFEDDINNIELLKNEKAIALPFYPSKLNDALEELLNRIEQFEVNHDENMEKYIGNILVAEDNSTNQELISHILERFDLNYTIKKNGLEALNEYKSNALSYDIVLMDWNMPIMDGITASQEIRNFEKENNLREVLIIALTANAIKTDKEKFLDAGANDYLTKPIDINKLQEIFQTYLKVKDDSTYEEINIQKICKKLYIKESTASLLIEKFKNEILLDLDELENFIKVDNYENIYTKTHYIKNSCLNIALDDICKLLEILELRTSSNEERIQVFNNIKKRIYKLLKPKGIK